jgi:hypothetical protein
MTYYLSFDKSNMSSAFGWEGTACHFIIVNDDAVLSLSLSAEIATLYTGTHEILLEGHINRKFTI